MQSQNPLGERKAERAAVTVEEMGATYIERHAKPHKKKAPVVAPPETGEIMMGDYAEPEPIAHVEID